MFRTPFRSLVAGLLTLCLLPAITLAEITVEENIIYGTGGGQELMLDLARPDGEGPFPAIVFIHGGGWHGGSRKGYIPAIKEAARRGYVAVTITYRLMTFDQTKKETTTAAPIFPAQIEDAKAAVRWVRAKAEKYQVDPDRIGVTGGSAGGHLSLLVGLSDDKDGLEGSGGNPQQSSRVQAVVNVYGPTEMARCYETSSVDWIFRLFMGGTPEEVSETYTKASPITYVSSDDPPVLTLQGDSDLLVPVEQARLLDEKMKAVGATHELIVFEGQGHGFQGEAGVKAITAMWDFFEKHLKP
ncbi:alpha/beta hydrolase [Rubinisphaera margarita]|uniref:alpha/beta hydrolase n=1 Tax=Rubinisphaera margarita TaxID=2909586 RepID=UPI001EE857D9|nr:alpha/beta hydrolase [Rubinisphaera margarita]MCG6158288.1 alpha/beta hydrolase [Rubinisphaera margarita]